MWHIGRRPVAKDWYIYWKVMRGMTQSDEADHVRTIKSTRKQCTNETNPDSLNQQKYTERRMAPFIN